MAIKVNNTTVIDDSKNLVNVGTVTFNDATVLSSAPAVGAVNIGYNNINIANYITLDNPNAYSTSADDWFGESVAISGNYAIVGARVEDDAGGFDSGKAYIFNVTTGALLHTLDNPNPFGTSTSDFFGWVIAIDGNYAIVGTFAEDDSGGTTSGKAYIYNVTTGALLHTLDNPNAFGTSATDNFGWAVAIDGNYAIVGAYYEGDTGGAGSGKAYIFNVTTGVLVHTLNNPNAFNTSADDYFGYRAAISGNYAIVSAIQEDDAGGLSSGKAYIFNVTTGALLHTLDNPNAYSTSGGDNFSVSVAISGNYAIVGAYLEDDAGGTNSGKAYIFDVTTGALVHTLNNPNAYSTSATDYFGYSVAISGNYAIVSAYLEDDTGGSGSGKAYIFNVTTGSLVYTLDNPNAYSTSVSDNFGRSVAISGNYAIVGARTEDDAGGSGSGKAYLFPLSFVLDRIDQIELSDKTFLNKDNIAFKNASFNATKLLHTLDNPNAASTSASDYFGYSVAISGNYAIIGVYLEDRSGTSSGIAYIYNINTGALIHILDNPNAYSTSTSDQFGYSVGISGNYAIVSAYAEDDAGGSNSGKAYIFNVTTGELVHTLNNPNPYSISTDDFFGVSVAIDGNYAIVGAYAEDDAGGSASGKAYIFNVTTGTLVHTLDNPNPYSTSAADNFGYSVAISGNYAIVGAYFEDDSGGLSSGKAYIFNVTTGALVHTLNNPNAYSTSTSDNFGWTVAISGNYAIVGAYNEDDTGGTTSGKAYIFNVSTGALIRTLDNPNAFGTSASDFFGWTVAIDGNYAIVGAHQEDDSGGSNSGKVYIFDLTAGPEEGRSFTVTNSGTSNYIIEGASNPTLNLLRGFTYTFNINASGHPFYIQTVSGAYSSGNVYNDGITGNGTESGTLTFTVPYNAPNTLYYVCQNHSSMNGTINISDLGSALIHTLDNPNAYSTSTSDNFGWTVAISGNYAIVGAYNEDDAGGGSSGKAYLYYIDTNASKNRTVFDKLITLF